MVVARPGPDARQSRAGPALGAAQLARALDQQRTRARRSGGTGRRRRAGRRARSRPTARRRARRPAPSRAGRGGSRAGEALDRLDVVGAREADGQRWRRPPGSGWTGPRSHLKNVVAVVVLMDGIVLQAPAPHIGRMQLSPPLGGLTWGRVRLTSGQRHLMLLGGLVGHEQVQLRALRAVHRHARSGGGCVDRHRGSGLPVSGHSNMIRVMRPPVCRGRGPQPAGRRRAERLWPARKKALDAAVRARRSGEERSGRGRAGHEAVASRGHYGVPLMTADDGSSGG